MSLPAMFFATVCREDSVQSGHNLLRLATRWETMRSKADRPVNGRVTEGERHAESGVTANAAVSLSVRLVHERYREDGSEPC